MQDSFINTYLTVIILIFFSYTLSLSMNNKLITNSPSPRAIAYAKKTLALQKNLFHDPELTIDRIKIIFPDYQKLVIEKETAEKFDFFRDAIEFDSAKPNKRIIKLPKNVPACLTKQNVELIIRQDRDSMTREVIIDVFNAADFLGAKEKMFYPIAEAYVSKFDESDYGPEYQEIKRYLGIKHFYATGSVFEHDEEIIFTTTDYCSPPAEKLHSLEDLNYVTEHKLFTSQTREKLTEIRLQHHCIDNFDIEKIIKVFPNLNLLDLRYNKITALSIDNLSHLPDGFDLILLGNPISKIINTQIKKHPNNCTIRLNRTAKYSFNMQLKNVANCLNVSYRYLIHFCLFSVALVVNEQAGVNLVEKITNSTFIADIYALLSDLCLIYKAFKNVIYSIKSVEKDNDVLLD